MPQPALRIGTRGSPLALAQSHAVRDRLCVAHGFAPDEIEIRTIKTTGDRVQDRKLSEIGGKGLFTKEIEIALADNEVDLGVHSAKDMQTLLPDGLSIAACLKREDPRDVLICPKWKSIASLPHGATLGTASLRREAQVRRFRPDIVVQPLRGNVETRLRKVREGEFDAIILGMAGLRRLNLTAEVTELLPTQNFLPAVGQGTIAIETRNNDSRVLDLLVPINDEATAIALAVERAFLAVLDGSCRTPIAGYAELAGERVRFRGIVMRPDGTEAFETAREASIGEAVAAGADAGRELEAKMPPDFFTAHA